MNIQNLKCLLETAESSSVLSGNRPSICRPCQYVQNALDRIPVWHQIGAAVSRGSSAQHRLPMVLWI